MNAENETAKALNKPQEEKLHFLDSIEFNKKFIEQVFPEKNQIADPAIYENSDVLEITKNHFIREINGLDKNQNNTPVCLFSLGLNYLNKELFWSTIYGGQTKTPDVQQCVPLRTVLEIFDISSDSRKEKYTKLTKRAVQNKENLLVLLNHSLLRHSCQSFVGNFILTSRSNFDSQQNIRPVATDGVPYIRPLQHTPEPNVIAEVVLGEDGHVIENTAPDALEATDAPNEEAANAEEIVIEAVATPEAHNVVGEAIGDAIADIADYDEEDDDEEDGDYDEEDDDAVDVNIEDRVVENITIDDVENPVPEEHMETQQQVVEDQAHEPAPIGHINVPNETLNMDGALPDWFLDRFPDYRTPTNPTGYIDPPALVNELLHAQLTDIPRTQGTIIGADLLELYFGDDICNYMRTHTYITADTGEVARGLNTLTNVIAFIREYAHRHCLDINTSFLSVLLTMLNTNELCFKMYTSERLHTICYTIQRATTTYGEVTDETQPDRLRYITDEELQRIPHIDLVAVQDLIGNIGTEYYQQQPRPYVVENVEDQENNTRG